MAQETKIISIRVGSNTNSNTRSVEDSMTPKELFVHEEIDFSTAIVYLSGSTVTPEQMNTSFADLGIVGTASLIAVIKQNNG